MAWKGALSKSLQELRIHLCQTGAGSAGAREFVLRNYAELKQANPHFPILIREAAGVEAKLVARYEHGVEKAVSVQNDAPAAITSKLQALVSSAPK